MSRRRRAAVLLEILLAAGLFATAAIVIFGAVSQSVSALDRVRLRAQADDLAFSAMARLEAGLASPSSLQGPAVRWTSADADLPDDPLDTAPGEEGLWELAVDVEPAPFDGLSVVTIHALRYATPGSTAPVASSSLAQLVRLRPDESDAVGRPGDLAPDAPAGGTP